MTLTLTRTPALYPAAPEPARRTLLDVLAETAAKHPDEAAVDAGGTVLTYRRLADEIDAVRGRLADAGIGVGDRVGVRISSGTAELYVTILAVLATGAAYVPVDADDPAERAELVFGEAGVCAVLGDDGSMRKYGAPIGTTGTPGPGDDAWIIFTSGSTGTPKGVAVSHGSAAAFVDAEARLFLADEPIGPGDRVLAGLSVAFDASCEEMWLAWRHGACLVPAPRALVRTGVDLGPWLEAQRITVVSTVPTLAALWPPDALEEVRLLILGGEACPPELAERLAVEGREVWNTYGPTEATVVACAAQLTGQGPVRIGMPLDGWALAVVDGAGEPVAMGESGELVISGVGLARYLDPDRDAARFAPLPSLGWDRAYRSGDVVRADEAGLLFLGRADDQVKLGGRRIELGEVDAALLALPGVRGAAAAVRRTRAGNQVLVGYVVPDGELDTDTAALALRERLPAALVPLLAVVDDLPTRTSGKVDRDALPWPLRFDTAGGERARPRGGGTADSHGGLAGRRLGRDPRRVGERPEGRLLQPRRRQPHRGAAGRADPHAAPAGVGQRRLPAPQAGVTGGPAGRTHHDHDHAARRHTDTAPRGARAGPAHGTDAGAGRPALGGRRRRDLDGRRPPGPLGAHRPVVVARGGLAPPVQPRRADRDRRGRRPAAAARRAARQLPARRLGARAAVGGHPARRAVRCDGRLGASWTTRYARALGAKIGNDVDLHSAPPVTGLLKIGRGAAVAPEVDLGGYWVDGDVVRIGKIRIGAGATVGSRSTLLPGARIGKGAEIAAGSTVHGAVPAGQRWAGSPARRAGKSGVSWPSTRPARSRSWALTYGVTSMLLGLVPAVAALPALAIVAVGVAGTASPAEATSGALLMVAPATVAYLVTYAVLVVVGVRLLGIGMAEGFHPVHSRAGWQVWVTERLMGMARTGLFPLYSSQFTAAWLRLLGARIGRDVEASTVIALPKMTTVADGAFLADDTMVGTYELSGGWMHVAPSRVGKQAFLGNSGMTAPGRSVPNRGLVGVLSATPRKAKKGSSWLGLPPMPLRRAVERGDTSRTFHPPRHLKIARGLIELCRVVPVMCSAALAVLVVGQLMTIQAGAGFVVAAVLAGPLLLAAGVVAVCVTTAMKWLLVGRFRPVEHPLWSSFVWRDELADTFVEVLAVPWLVGHAGGTPVLTAWLRSMGASIGRGVWLETYWLPESDLVRLGDGATVNRGCVVQTHLFHDRIMSMDEVRIDEGATVGPNGIILPGASIGAGTTIGPGSLVTRGDTVPAATRWLGNPITTWD